MNDPHLSRDSSTERGTLTFFALALALNWLADLPALLVKVGVLAGPIERFMPLVGLGAFSPLIAAWIVVRRESGKAGVRTLMHSVISFRAQARWYVVAFTLPGMLLALGMAVRSWFGGEGRWFYPPVTGAAIAAVFIVPLVEEIGWRGYALPRLQRRYGPLQASLGLGMVWALWHSPCFVVLGFGVGTLLLMFPFFMAGSVVFTWLYNRPGGGLPLVILAHAGAHLNNSHQTLPADPTPFVVHTIGYCLLAFVLIVRDPRVWGYAARWEAAR